MNNTLLQLQATLRDRFPVATASFSSRAEQPDLSADTIQLQNGRLVEIVASGPGTGMILIQLLTGLDHAVALVDGADALDLHSIWAEMPQNLLWVRCRKATEAVRAADLLLRDGNLRTVLMDLRLLPQRELLDLSSSVWHRLRMLAERAGTAVAVFSPCKVVACAARRWALPPGLDLSALEQPREALQARLRPSLASGIGLAA